MSDTDHDQSQSAITDGGLPVQLLIERSPVLACSPRVAGKLFNFRQWHLTQAIMRGEITTHAIGRRVVVLCADVAEWIRAHPPAKTPSAKHIGKRGPRGAYKPREKSDAEKSE